MWLHNMATLNLNISQRVNIIAMLDGVEAHGRREAWAVCRLQDQFRLTDEEREQIGWKIETVATPQGPREFATWKPDYAARELKPFTIEADDVKRLCAAIDQFRMVPGRDRVWWAPLVEQLPEAAEPTLVPASQAVVNGQAG